MGKKMTTQPILEEITFVRGGDLVVNGDFFFNF